MHHPAVGQLPHTRHPFVDRVVNGEIVVLQVFAPLPPVVGLSEENLDIIRRAGANQQSIARQAAGLINQVEVVGQRVSSSMASCKDATMRAKAS